MNNERLKRSKKPPWRYPREDIPSRATLMRWRRVALSMAKKAGFKTCCDICKRPLARAGVLTIISPTTVRQRVKKRKLCEECWIVLSEIIDTLEWLGNREDHV
jgi:hypothetical protein